MYDANMTFDDGPKAPPIPNEGDKKVAPRDSLPGDQAGEIAAKGPWSSIGRRFVQGIPFIKARRH